MAEGSLSRSMLESKDGKNFLLLDHVSNSILPYSISVYFSNYINFILLQQFSSLIAAKKCLYGLEVVPAQMRKRMP